MYDRSSIDLNVSTTDRQLSTSELIARQNSNTSLIDIALLERMYDSGRYFFVSSSGVLPPRLTGIWTGTWNGSWADDLTTDANVNFQVAGGNILDLTDAMQGCFDLVLGQLADWRTNAQNIYGNRGFLAPIRTDGENGHMLHFDGSFPGQAWIGGADWLLYPLLEYYQVTGDSTFYRTKPAPALMELALFYEDFLTRTDSSGKVVFVPCFSVENHPGNSNAYLSINSTGEIAAGRHALQAAIDAANTLGVEQGSGQGVARWTDLLAKLPDYRVNSDGAPAEWAWPSLTDHYNNNHAQHMYGVWPLHEINPEDKPDLVLRARKAPDLRGDETQAAHGAIHRTLARARLKDGPGVYANLRKILGNNMVFKSLMTSHNPNLTIYNADAANALPAMLTESLIYSRPGILEVLPALPDQLPNGTIKGVRGRNRIRVESLAWDTTAHTATVVLTSDITQDVTLVCRRGITSVTTSATVTSSSLGSHARVVSLTAGTRTTITIGLLTGTFRLVNRRSGTVLDIKDGSTADSAPAIIWTWNTGTNQQWQFLPNHDGSFRPACVKSGKLLECPGGSTTQGQTLDQSTDNTGAHQWSKLVPAANGYHRIVNVKSGMCVDAQNGYTADGTPLIQWPPNTGSNQEWQIVAL
ncbi:glycosyl hydrolase family 95 catalytic domain-containing protein [Streptomyces sp. NPDC001348]